MAGKRVHKVNEDFFASLTPISAYWLGFIQADGCVYANRSGAYCQLGIELNEKDIHLLEQFKRDLSASYEIKSYRKGLVSFKITSLKLCADLINLGVLPRKSSTGSFPIISDPELYRHYIRGVFDGDGSIMMKKRKDRSPRPRTVILGSRNFCLDALTRIRDLAGISVGGVYSYTSIFGVTFEGYPSNYKLYEWLYKDSERFLARKRDRFIESFVIDTKMREVA